MTQEHFTIGTIAASEALLEDLYIGLRIKIRAWSLITQQTPQARMGYIGQHLVSVVTGFHGGRSGARGKDLMLPDGESAEIKTCYRVDQLGSCSKCLTQVSSVESACPICQTEDIKRKDDSKWLIAVKGEEELKALFEPRWYYLVLFDFTDITTSTDINARIWRIDPKSIGFSYCMIDYYFNIKSSAPFNLWPFMLKFYLMKPELIYHSVISSLDDSVTTILFEGQRGKAKIDSLQNLENYARSSSDSLSDSDISSIAAQLNIDVSGLKRKEMLQKIQAKRDRKLIPEQRLLDLFAKALYGERISPYLKFLPSNVKKPAEI